MKTLVIIVDLDTDDSLVAREIQDNIIAVLEDALLAEPVQSVVREAATQVGSF